MVNDFQKLLLAAYPNQDLLNFDPADEPQVEDAVREGTPARERGRWLFHKLQFNEGGPSMPPELVATEDELALRSQLSRRQLELSAQLEEAIGRRVLRADYRRSGAEPSRPAQLTLWVGALLRSELVELASQYVASIQVEPGMPGTGPDDPIALQIELASPIA